MPEAMCSQWQGWASWFGFWGAKLSLWLLIPTFMNLLTRAMTALWRGHNVHCPIFPSSSRSFFLFFFRTSPLSLSVWHIIKQ